MSSTSVFLIDTNKLFREGIKRLFENSPFTVVGEAGNAHEAAAALETASTRPELILIDPNGGADDLEAVRALRATHPEIRVVILTGTLDTRLLSGALGAGADGYLMKDIACDALMQSLRLVMMGEKVFPTHLAALLVSGRAEDMGAEVPTRRKGLSQREVQILRCLLDGNNKKMIANRLHITEATVKVHLKSLLRKINASNLTQAAIWAMNNGVGDLPVDDALSKTAVPIQESSSAKEGDHSAGKRHVEDVGRHVELSRREVEVLHCLLNGDSDKMIANHLRITASTVQRSIGRLLRKIKVANRTQAAIWALNNGIGASDADKFRTWMVDSLQNKQDDIVNAHVAKDGGVEKSAGSQPKLSHREINILHFIIANIGIKEISGRLNITEEAAKARVRRIFRKIGVSSSAQATIWAIEHGIVDKSWGGEAQLVVAMQVDAAKIESKVPDLGLLVEQRASSLPERRKVMATSETHGGTPDVTMAVRRRLSEQPYELAAMAEALSTAVCQQIEDLPRDTPNDPDALGVYEQYGAFLEEFAIGLADVHDAIVKTNQAPDNEQREENLTRAAKLIAHLGSAVESWLKSNAKAIIDYGFKTALLGIGTAFLSMCGVPAWQGVVPLAAVLSGRTLLDGIEAIRSRRSGGPSASSKKSKEPVSGH